MEPRLSGLMTAYKSYLNETTNPIRRHLANLPLVCIAFSNALTKEVFGELLKRFSGVYETMLKNRGREDSSGVIYRLVMLLLYLCGSEPSDQAKFANFFSDEKERLSPGGQSLGKFFGCDGQTMVLDHPRMIETLTAANALNSMALQGAANSVESVESFHIVAPITISDAHIVSQIEEYLSKAGYAITVPERDDIVGRKTDELPLEIRFTNMSGGGITGGIAVTVDELVN